MLFLEGEKRMVRAKIKGMGALKKQLKSVPKITRTALQETIKKVTEEIASTASLNVQTTTIHGTGELANSISADHEEWFGSPVSIVRTNSPIGTFREFGTGSVGEASEKDLPDGINPVYTQDEWFFPVESVDKDLNALYGMRVVNIKGTEFYVTNGQPARPFLYPAYKAETENMDKLVKENVSKALKEKL